jgi:hypothetical protein
MGRQGVSGHRYQRLPCEVKARLVAHRHNITPPCILRLHLTYHAFGNPFD